MDYGENSHYVSNDNKLIIHKTNEDDIRQYSCLVSKKSAPKSYLDRADIKTLGEYTFSYILCLNFSTFMIKLSYL